MLSLIQKNNNISQDTNSQHHLDYEFIEYLLDTQNISHEYTTSWRYSTNCKIIPIISKEISNILNKLYELFTRCEQQKESISPNSQVVYSDIKNIYSKRNLNCGR